ncbi:MAG: PD-(D/E)XK nuclease family protein [Acidimicrobiia bacterium]
MSAERAVRRPAPGSDAGPGRPAGAGHSAPRLIVAAHGPDARTALFEQIAAHRGRHPLVPVTVAVPSTYTGLSLRRGLGRRPPGIVNVRFLSLGRVAELLGAPFLAEPGRRPLTPALATGAVRAVLADDDHGFGALADHPATVRSLLATFRDLRSASEATLASLASGGGRAGATVRAYVRFRDRVAAYYDDEDQLLAAARVAAAGGPALDEVGTVIVFLPRSLSPGARALLRELVARGRGAIVLATTGDAEIDAEVHGLADELAHQLPGLGTPHVRPAPSLPTADRIISAPDADEEVRGVVRAVFEALEHGTPLHRMAITFRAAVPYARLLHEQLAAAGIPAHGPSPRRLSDTAPGRLLLGLLALPDRDFRRDSLAELFASTPIVETPGGRTIPGPLWDRLSCEANVVAGLGQWSQRLAYRADERRVELERRAQRDGALFADTRTDPILEHCTRLDAFVTDLAARLTPPQPASWSVLAEWADDLLARYFGPSAQSHAPDAELVALEKVRVVVRGLAVLDELAAPASVTALRRALDEQLDVAVGHIGAFGDGVMVAPLGALVGTDHEQLFVLGLREGAFPPAARDDPLLPDRDRPDGMPGRSARASRERTDWLTALASAQVRTLTVPRADARARRGTRPAAWLLETASARAGRHLGAGDLEPGRPTARDAGASGWYRVIPSFAAGLTGDGVAATLQELDVRSLVAAPGSVLRHPLVRGDARLAAGMRAQRSRAGRTLDAWDGNLGTSIALGGSGARLSPSALEAWAGCPFRYLLSHILRVGRVQRPETRDRVDPRVRGTLVHDVLETFLRAHPRPDPAQGWSDAERAALRRLAEDRCDEAEAAGLTGRSLLWAIDRPRLLRELDELLELDAELRAEHALVPEDFELSFGNDDDRLPPVTVPLADGVPVHFRGRIDRVDRGPDGRIHVFDYKTGRPDVTRAELVEDPVLQGRKLQLAVYGLAVRPLAAGAPVEASYWFTREASEDAIVGFPVDADAEERLLDVIGVIGEGVASGSFPAYPGRDDYWTGPTRCNEVHCEYTRLCPADRVRRFERRRGDPAFAGLLSLVEDTGSDAPDDDGAGDDGTVDPSGADPR